MNEILLLALLPPGIRKSFALTTASQSKGVSGGCLGSLGLRNCVAPSRPAAKLVSQPGAGGGAGFLGGGCRLPPFCGGGNGPNGARRVDGGDLVTVGPCG